LGSIAGMPAAKTFLGLALRAAAMAVLAGILMKLCRRNRLTKYLCARFIELRAAIHQWAQNDLVITRADLRAF
jgi:hypothetical protein